MAVFVGRCGAVASMLTDVGHLKHGHIVATLLLYLLCGLATSVIFVTAPEVVPAKCNINISALVINRLLQSVYKESAKGEKQRGMGSYQPTNI